MALRDRTRQMQPLASQGSADEATIPSLSSESESSEDDTCLSSTAFGDDVGIGPHSDRRVPTWLVASDAVSSEEM